MGPICRGSTAATFTLGMLALLAAATSHGATGRIEATADVTRTGAFRYQIPIWAPPGPRGIQPNLAVVYDSTAGENRVLVGTSDPDTVSLGPGWTLSGLSIIHRCSRSAAQDAPTMPAGPFFGFSDAYCINGQRLRLTGGSYGQDGSTYQTEIADFSLITAHGTTGYGPSHFTVRSKDGITYEFGNTTDSRILLPNQGGNMRARVWLLNKVSSQAAHYTVTYGPGDSGSVGIGLPTTISWSPTSSGSSSYQYTMSFTYAPRSATERITNYKTGQLLVNANLLSAITVRHGTTVTRHYRFTYETSPTTQRSRLQNVRECADEAMSDCLAPTNMSYVQGALGVSQSAGNAPSGVTDVIGAYDFNGDGRADILYNVGGTLYVAFAAGSGFQTGQNTGIAVTASDRYDVDDLVGSGRAEILITRSGAWWRYSWTGSAFAGASTGVAWNPGDGPNHMELADHNGDGLPDLITITTVRGSNQNYYYGTVRVRHNTSSNGALSFASTESTLPTPDCTLTFGCVPHLVPTRPWSQPRDLNADGRPDLLLGTQSIGMNVVQSQFYSLLANPTAYTIVNSSAHLNAIGYLRWNDDRCADVVTSVNSDPNNGSGNIVVAACDGLAAQSLPFSGVPVGVVDWNGDGRTDLLVKNGSILSVYQSTGSGISARIDTPFSAGDKVIPLEVDGDGLPDLLIASGTSPYTLTYRLHNDVGSLADQLSAVTDGFGVTMNISYVSITAGNYSRGSGPAAADPEEDWLAPYWVVRTLTSSDGIGGTYTQTFEYAGARKSRLRGFEGFQMKQVTDSRTLQVRRTHYETLFPRTGMVKREELFKPGGSVLISSVEMSNTHLVLDSAAYTQRYFPYASTITSKSYDLADTSSTQDPITVRTVALEPPDTYGNFGGVTETLEDKDTDSPFYNQSWTTVTTTSYTPNPGNWCVSQPTGVTIAKSAPGQPTITRMTSYGVDYTNCRASSETIEPGTSYAITRSFGFDAFGNIESEAVSGVGVPSRTTSIGWGSTGQFPGTITDPIGNAAGYRLRRGYDYAKGVLTSEVIESLDGAARNSPETSWGHDTFGRVTRETRPDGTSVRWSYADCTSGCFNTNHRSTVTMTALDANTVPISDQLTYLDRLARPLATRQKLLDGSYSQTERQYDARGRLRSQSVPCSASGCAPYWITNDYDDLNRLTQVSRPIKDNTPTLQTTKFDYLGRTTVVTDAQLKTTRKTYDVAGNLRISQDHTGHSQSFTYDSFGSVTSVVDSASGPLFSATYDYGVSAFQRTRNDRSLGSRASTYNALGEVQTYTDAKNQSFAMTYDALGRPLTRRDGVTGETTQESKTTWTWGQNIALHNVGQLQSVSFESAGETYSEAHFYDGIARLDHRDITLPGEGTYTYNFGYDSATGLLDTLVYPTSTASSRLTLRYCYQYGYLQKVAQGSCTGTAFWQANAMNSRGQITNETLGNGITTQRTFDAVTGWMSTLLSGTGGNPTAVQNESYLFDLVGNVTQRQNNSLGLTEDFFYDDLYRLDYTNLTNSSGTVQNLDLSYQDAFGNIQTKTEAGYTAPAVDQDVEWTSFNYPKRITATVLGGGPQTASFAYGPDRQRWRMVYQNGSTTETTHYIGGLMEKVTAGSTTDYRHYIYAGHKLAAIFSSGSNTVRYVLEDHQSSVASILDSSGARIVDGSFTAYGNRRDASTWSNVPSASSLATLSGITRQGYTGHTALGTMGLNHMNGRVQDAITGSFLSPDPYVMQPGNTQGFNRYAYAHNNPLTFIDPSGFDIVCWVPPFTYNGGPTNVNGIEGVISQGPGEQCLYLPGTPGLYPPGPPGGGGGGGGGPPVSGETPSTQRTCPERDPDLERRVREDPANGYRMLWDGKYPAMTEGVDFALVVAISGSSTYVADFKSWTVHEFSSVSFGAGARLAAWASRGYGNYYASGSDEGVWDVGAEVSGMLGLGLISAGFKAEGKGVVPGGTVTGQGGLGLIDVGVSAAVSGGRYVRGWALGEVPYRVRKWFADQYNKACRSPD